MSTTAVDFELGATRISGSHFKPGGKNPQTITSPAAQRHFDDIGPVAGLRWTSKVEPKKYSVEAAIPFAALGIEPRGVIGFDVSVAFANDAGTERARAAHWAGETEARVVDRPGSAELKPRTWGTLRFEPKD